MVVQGSFWQGGSEILKLQPDGRTVTIKTPVASKQIIISGSDSNVLYVTASSNGGYPPDTPIKRLGAAMIHDLTKKDRASVGSLAS